MENYEILDGLGSGNFGVTKKVINKKTKEVLAMKFIRHGKIAAKYVEREIVNHRGLQHPNVIQLKEVILDDNMLGIVMEFADRGELHGEVLITGPFTEAKARKLFQQLIAGLAYIHSKRTCHRDLKPENILLNSKGVLKICDFGLSKSSEMQSMAKTPVGTHGYMAPEVENAIRSGASYEGRLADVWSCGMTLYEMLTTESLCRRGRVECINSLKVSDDCKNLLRQMLRKDPTKRITVEKIKKHEWYLKDLPPDLKEEAQAAIRNNPNVTSSCQTEEDIMKIVAEIRKSYPVLESDDDLVWESDDDLVLETDDEAAEISIAAQEDHKDITDMKNGI